MADMEQAVRDEAAGEAKDELGGEGGRSGGGVAGEKVADGEADGSGESAVFAAEQEGGEHDEGGANVDLSWQAAAEGDFDAEEGEADEGEGGKHGRQSHFQDGRIAHGGTSFLWNVR